MRRSLDRYDRIKPPKGGFFCACRLRARTSALSTKFAATTNLFLPLPGIPYLWKTSNIILSRCIKAKVIDNQHL